MTMFTPEQRTAIGELVKFAEVVAESNHNRPNKRLELLAAMLCERAANIIRGESPPHIFTDDDVIEFAKTWDVTDRAAFNPRQRRRRKEKTQ